MLQEEFEKDYETIDEELLELSILQQLEPSMDDMTLPLVIESPMSVSSQIPFSSPQSSSSTRTSDLRRSKRTNKSPIPLNQSTSHNFIPNNQITIQNKKKVPLKHFSFNWKKCSSERFSVDIPINQKYATNDFVKTPLEYFFSIFSKEVFDLIVNESNLYSYQKFNTILGTNTKEIHDLIGILLLMGIVKMPAYTDYWAPNTRYSQISNVMSLKRYKLLLKCLHFCNNEELDESDRFFKVRKLMDIIRNNCLSIPQGKRFSIDEMMILYKGKKAGSRKQYMKNKPKKWGFKIFVRAGIDGMVYDFLAYSGDCTFRNIHFSLYELSYFGLGPKVVIALSSSIPKKPMSVIYFDNFFTTPELISYLRSEFGILSLGTLRKQHLRGCQIDEDKKLMKKPRGTYVYCCDTSKKVTILKWLDNKVVCLASSYTKETKTNNNVIQRYSKVTKKKFLCLTPT